MKEQKSSSGTRRPLTQTQKDQIFRLRQMREKVGLKQEQFASYVGLAPSTYKKLESYQYPLQIKHLEALREHLPVSSDYILFGKETSSSLLWKEVMACSREEQTKLLMRLYAYVVTEGQSEISENNTVTADFETLLS